MGRRSLFLLLFLTAVVTFALLNHYFVSQGSAGYNDGPFAPEAELSRATGISDPESRIRDMLRIRNAVAEELRTFEAKRQALVSEISDLRSRGDSLKSDLIRVQKEVDRTRSLLQQLELDRTDAARRKSLPVLRPLNLLPAIADQSTIRSTETPDQACDMWTCFNFSRCPLTSRCPVYLYPDTNYNLSSKLLSRKDIIWTKDPASACLLVAVLLNSSNPSETIRNGSEWRNGENHLLFAPNSHFVHQEREPLAGKSILIGTKFTKKTFRANYDMVSVPFTMSDVSRKHSVVKPVLSPARRKYMAVCSVSNDTAEGVVAINLLQRLQSQSGEKLLFSSETFEDEILAESTFYLIFVPHAEHQLISSQTLTTRVMKGLEYGSIPVIISRSDVLLPLHQVIDWHKALILIPAHRVTELFLILKSIHDKDLLEIRRMGRILFHRYFQDYSHFIAAAIVAVRQHRLQTPGPAIPAERSESFYDEQHRMRTFEVLPADPETESAELDEVLGPTEDPFPSESFERNYSLVLNYGYDLWNSASLVPFFSFPSTPFDPTMPSESKFVGSEYGFRPIGAGSGGSGKEFSQALGGNDPKEQFTIVMLTYEREAVLLDSLQRLKGMPFLNKVVVVWNHPTKRPDPSLIWPDIQIPLTIIRAEKNSLNNRFLPFDVIETDAILSMDDDAHLRHDEIVFGFRVWREARDRIVGFPGRFHAWDTVHNSWLYNSNYSCELSMVLTGAAFFHKYYAYMYTSFMPQIIRNVVDEFTNCEDIAMNFLISHMTRKPPIKVTSRWTFSCPGCPVALSESDSHFEERHKCINIFTEVFGYNPLLNTQFRADSVLFKTRIPRDKQKCFRHV